MDIKIIASGSSGNCYRVSDGATSVLLDCGIPAKEISRALDFKLSAINGVLVTHNHQDHIKAAKDLAKLGLPIYASKGTLDACNLNGSNYVPVSANVAFNVNSLCVTPFDVEHDAPEPLGFIIKSSVTNEILLYFTDTCYLKYKIPHCNYILAECNYSIKTISPDVNKALMDRVIQSHMSLETLAEWLKDNDLSNLKQIYLIHLSDGNSNAEYFKCTVQEITGTEVYVC